MISAAFMTAAALAVILALAFVIAPLLGARRQLLLVLALFVSIPMATVLLYGVVGTPEGISPERGNVEHIRESLIGIARELERHPENAENWVRIGLAYKELQEYSSAEHALRRALFIDEDNSFIQVELAESLLFASRQPHLPAEAKQLLEYALASAPDNQKALWLLGLDAFQRQDYVEAERRLATLDSALPDGSVRDSIRQYLDQARNRLGRDESTTGFALEVTIEIDALLAERLTGSEVVFVIVRAAGVSGPPLAVQRLTASDLPASINIDNRNAMLPNQSLADFDSLVVTARVSMSGQAAARDGDFEGQSDPVETDDVMQVRIRIDREL